MNRLNGRRSRASACLALVLSLVVAWAPVAPLVQAQAAKAAGSPANPAPATAQTAAAAGAPDGGWPRAYTTNAGAALVIYQPQVSSWKDQRHVVLYAAVSYTAKGAPKPAFGTLKVESDTSLSLETRLVSFSDFKVTESSFAALTKEQVRDLLTEVSESVPLQERVIGLDRVLAGVDASEIIPKNADGIKADPPTVFFSKTPAILVNIDGEPIWNAVASNDLKVAINTNWDLFEHTPTRTYYLLAKDTWLKATDVKGPWTYAGPLPESFKKLPADQNFAEVKAALPGKKVAADKAPKAFVSLTPAEMILLTGEPKYVPVTGAGSLLWVSNTDADVFRMGPTGPVYYLVAGRWFSAPDFTGPWTFVTPTLPGEFKRIPLEHDRSRVLASVPGTQQAAEAVLLAQIPQTARVTKATKAPEVTYDGDPKFVPIEKTQVSRAVNTDKDIIKYGDLYYMCFQGVWFMAKSATGPWEVTGNVPKPIYEIPPSSPSYNVTYVTVQESNDDAVVFATALAFTGLMIAWGCAVHGSGYYYPPYYGWHGGYPYYYPHYPTYGYGASYNPWTGTYGRGAVAYGPYGGAGVSAKYNPRTGTYARSAGAYGPYGSAAVGQAYNPRTGGYGQTRQASNVYGSWGSTTVARGDQWAQSAHVTNNRTGATTAAGRTSEGGAAAARSGIAGNSAIARTGSGDVYAGHDGNVYKKDGDTWQKSDGSGGWNTVQQPTDAQRQQAQSQAQTRAQGAQAGTQAATQARGTGAAAGTQAAGSGWTGQTASQVQRDAGARTAGTERTSAYSGVKSGASKPSSYKGGSSRSGGGARRR